MQFSVFSRSLASLLCVSMRDKEHSVSAIVNPRPFILITYICLSQKRYVCLWSWGLKFFDANKKLRHFDWIDSNNETKRWINVKNKSLWNHSKSFVFKTFIWKTRAKHDRINVRIEFILFFVFQKAIFSVIDTRIHSFAWQVHRVWILCGEKQFFRCAMTFTFQVRLNQERTH